MESNVATCYICLGEETQDEKFMTESPCDCKGSINIHWPCFTEHVKTKTKCGICKNNYEYKIEREDDTEYLCKEITHRQTYYPCGTQKEKGSFINGIKDGLWKGYYKSGTVYYEGPYVKGLRNGYWRFYYESGNLRAEGLYINWTNVGHWKTYYESGSIKSEGSYINGKKARDWKEYIDVLTGKKRQREEIGEDEEEPTSKRPKVDD